MKKKILTILGIMCVCCLSGCGNYEMLDMTYTYDTAIIKLVNDEVIEVSIKSWCDYDGEQLQITAEDGTVYLTSSFRCDLIKSK